MVDGVLGVSDALDLSDESSLGVSVVLDDPLGAIGLVQGVRSLDVVAVAVLPGLLVVAGVGVLHSVLELVWDGGVVLLMVVVVSSVVAGLQVDVSVALSVARVRGHGGNGDSGQDTDLEEE